MNPMGVLLILCTLPVYCADQSTEAKENDRKDLTTQLALLKDMFKAPDGYTYLVTAKVHDTQYLLVYYRIGMGDFKIKEVTENGVFQVSLTDNSCWCKNNQLLGFATLQLNNSSCFPKSKKIIYSEVSDRAALTDEKWGVRDIEKKSLKFLKKICLSCLMIQ